MCSFCKLLVSRNGHDLTWSASTTGAQTGGWCEPSGSSIGRVEFEYEMSLWKLGALPLP